MGDRKAMAILLVPTLFAIAFVLDAYGLGGGPWTELVRPLAVISLGSLAFTVLTFVSLGRRPLLASSLGIAFVFIVLRPAAAFLIIVVIGGGLLMRRLPAFRRTGPSRDPMRTWLLITALVPLALTGAGLWFSGALAPEDFTWRIPSSPTPHEQSSELPNIYLLVLDGYPRGDELAADFDIDNDGFTNRLTQLGFRVYPNAESRFTSTKLTFASTMMADPNELIPLSVTESDDEVRASWRELRRRYLVNTMLMDRFREAGYRLTYLPADGGGVEWQGWDRTITSAYATDFEVTLVQHSALADALDGWLVEQLRLRSAEVVRQWSAIGSSETAELVLGHVMPPHPPFLWGPDGPQTALLPCWHAIRCSHQATIAGHLWLTTEEYGRNLSAQIEAVNAMVLAAVEQITERDPTAVIVVMSDHGGRYSEDDAVEAHHTLLAARIPHEPDLLSNQPGPDALFVRLYESLPWQETNKQPSDRDGADGSS